MLRWFIIALRDFTIILRAVLIEKRLSLAEEDSDYIYEYFGNNAVFLSGKLPN